MRAFPFVLASVVALTSCAPADDSIELAEHELVVCGDGPTVEGIDVSQWQSTIDWDAVAASGIRYAIVRIGDGLGHDTQFSRNWPEAQRVGLLRGAYQFFRPSRDVNAQADIVIAAVGVLGPGDLPVTIDVEAPDPGVSPAAYTAAIHTWVDRVTAGTGRAPIVYTGRYYWDPYVATSDFTDLPLWHAQYTSAACPNINDRWSRWAFWQYTSTGSVPGISGNVDRNRWNGTYETLEALAHVALCTPHCEGTTIVDASCGRGDCAAFGAGCAEDGPGARCVFFACPSLGDASVCVDDHTIGSCHDGAITTGDCGAFAAYCGTAGVTPTTARCVSVFCVPSADSVPVAHDVCLPSGQLAHCNDVGLPEDAHDCGAGTMCVGDGAGASCVDPTIPIPMPDAAMSAGDAGPSQRDAAVVPTSDGSMVRDAGTGMSPTGDRSLSGGCSCGVAGRTTPANGGLVVMIAALAAVARRSRRR
jgi:MYXO-CTERM domain-containing protein